MSYATKGSQRATDRRTSIAGAVGTRGNRAVARALALLLMVPLGLSAAAPSLMQPTEAAWQLTYLTEAKATAVTIPAAGLTAQCRLVSLLGLGAFVQIYWAVPAGYDPQKAELHVSTGALGTPLVPLTGFDLNRNTTQNRTTQQYTTSVSPGLLTNLIGAGRERELAIVVKEHGWTSRPASVATNAGPLLGMGASCRNLA